MQPNIPETLLFLRTEELSASKCEKISRTGTVSLKILDSSIEMGVGGNRFFCRLLFCWWWEIHLLVNLGGNNDSILSCCASWLNYFNCFSWIHFFSWSCFVCLFLQNVLSQNGIVDFYSHDVIEILALDAFTVEQIPRFTCTPTPRFTYSPSGEVNETQDFVDP